MTVSSTTNTLQYSGNGVTTSFSFPYLFFATTDLSVTLFNTSTVADVSPAPVLNGTGTYDYTVTGTYDTDTGEYTAGGSVVFNTAPPTGYRITITRAVPATQSVTLVDNSKFPASTVNGEFDRLTILTQQNAAAAARALSFPTADPSSISPILPPAASRASLFLAFDSTGAPVVASGATSTGTTFTSFGQAWVAFANYRAAVGFYNVKAAPYNAAGDGIQDDKPAIDLAIAAITAAGGGLLFFPAGTYLVSSAITITASNVTLQGSGPEATIIKTNNATANVIVFSGGTECRIDGISFRSSVTRTAGYNLLFSNVYRGAATRIYSYQQFRTVGLIDSILVGVLESYFEEPHVSDGSGVYIDGANDQYLHDVRMNGLVGSQPFAAIHVVKTGALYLDTCGSVYGGNGLALFPKAASEIANVFSNKCTWDTGSGSGFYFETSSGRTIKACTFTNDWSSSNTAHGASITTGAGTITDIEFHGCRFYNNGQNGIVIDDGATNFGIIGCTVAANSKTTTNTYSGIRVDASVGFRIENCRIGLMAPYAQVHKYGIEINTVSNNYTIQGNTVLNSGTANISVADAISAARQVRNNVGFVTENAGTDTIPSGATSKVVTHGLSVTPALKDITITFGEQGTNDYGRWSVGTFTSTQFTLTVAADPGASNLDFGWQARVT